MVIQTCIFTKSVMKKVKIVSRLLTKLEMANRALCTTRNRLSKHSEAKRKKVLQTDKKVCGTKKNAPLVLEIRKLVL